MFKRVLVVCVLMVSGCQSAQQSSDARFASYETQRKEYFACGIVQARNLNRTNPNKDSIYIAIAAKQRCNPERQSVISGIMKAHNSAIWATMIDSMDKTFIELAVSQTMKP